MATIADKLSAIIGQKSDMVKNLNIKGVSSASDSEKFNTLVAKVLTVGGKNPYVKPGTGNTSSPTLNQKLGALYSQKNLLATYLTSMGVPASTSEKLNTLVPKILEIPMGKKFLYMLNATGSIQYSMPCATDKKYLLYDDITMLVTARIKTYSNLYFNSSQYNTIHIADSDYASRWYWDHDVTAWAESISINAGTNSYPFDDRTLYVSSGSISISYQLSNLISGLQFNKLKRIYDRMCYNRSALSTTYFAECSKIGTLAFAYCYNIQYANFPKLKEVEPYAFLACSSISMLVSESSEFDSAESLTSIGFSAFYGCYKLRHIKIDSTISGFNSTIFADCFVLTTIGDKSTMKQSDTVYLDNVEYISRTAFYNCYNLDGYLYTPSLKNIEEYAFYKCYSLWGINLTAVSCISHYAFYENSYIQRFGIQSYRIRMLSCTSIGSHAFELISILTSSNGTNVLQKGAKEFITSLSLPACKYIGDNAFTNRCGISTIYLPSCSYIGSYAFQVDRYIVKDNYPESIQTNPIYSISIPECLYVGAYAFYGCELTQDLSISKASVIGDHAFAKGLTQHIKTLGNYYGQSFIGPRRLTIPGDCSIGIGAFLDQNIGEIVYTGNIPISITIPSFAFLAYNCSGIRNYPEFSRVTYIGTQALHIDSHYSNSIHFKNLISTGYDPFFTYKGYYKNAIDTDIYVYKNNPAGAEVINTFANAIKASRYIYVKDMSYYLNIINESLSKRIKPF